jgi:predicted nucleic acid-binding protein
MISALDSSVILDVVTGDARFADCSEAVLRRAAREGRLIVCECVLAEILPAFGSTHVSREFLRDWQLSFLPSSLESALLAGEHFAAYLRSGGRGGRILADFLIAAHAQRHADRLVARDRGYLRKHFKGLKILDPSELGR